MENTIQVTNIDDALEQLTIIEKGNRYTLYKLTNNCMLRIVKSNNNIRSFIEINNISVEVEYSKVFATIQDTIVNEHFKLNSDIKECDRAMIIFNGYTYK